MMNSSLIITLIAMVAATLSLSACNTIGGAGQDIQKGGQSIEKAADTSR
jgi:predicted small secreted protein